MNLTAKNLLPIVIILITFLSANQWSAIPIGNTSIFLILDFITIIVVLLVKAKYFHPANKNDYAIISIYFFWMIIGVIRGCFLADNYWIWKQLVVGTFTLSLPIFVYVFFDPGILSNVLKKWLKFAIPVFFLFSFWVLSTVAYQFYLGPVLLLACFLPIIDSKKWKYILIGLLLLMMFADWGARSQVIKAVVAFMISGAYIFSKYMSSRILKIFFWTFICSPIVLLYLGISGQFNVFRDLEMHEGERYATRTVDGKKIKEDLASDTRTFIYEEVISSAIKHNYILWGRTPARGNDSKYFGSYMAENLQTGLYERHANEVCFPNVFTWLGFIGMVLYGLIYINSSYLAVYKSNNFYIKLLGVFIAFRFAYGWVEDINRFDIMNIALWMMISMGFSEQFREMDDSEFKNWVKTIFVTSDNRD